MLYKLWDKVKSSKFYGEGLIISINHNHDNMNNSTGIYHTVSYDNHWCYLNEEDIELVSQNSKQERKIKC